MKTETGEKLEIRCAACGEIRAVKPTATGKPRPPRHWKRSRDDLYCRDCWKERYVLRATTMQVANPGCDWKEFRAHLKHAWAQSTAVANWMALECHRRDVTRTPEMEKMPRWEVPYLYGDAAERFPLDQYGSDLLAATEHAVKGKYGQRRYHIVWLCRDRPPIQTFPAPYPIRNQNWRPEMRDNVPVVRCTIARRRFELVLRGGKGWRRQLAAFRDMAAGRAIIGEASIFERKTYVMLKLVAWLPRRERVETGDKTMRLRTDKDRFWIAEHEGRDDPWFLNADRVRGLQAEHRRLLQRMSEDLKHEKRWPKRTRRRMVRENRKRVDRYRRRIDNFLNVASKMLVQYAVRQRIKTVEYDDSIKDYVPEFPWSRLAEMLKTKLDAEKIGLLVQERVEEVSI